MVMAGMKTKLKKVKEIRRRWHKCMIGCAELEFDKNLNYMIYYDKKVVEISFSDKIKFKDL